MKILRKFKKGFTLVELVVVIAVIAILAAVSVGAYFGVTESANNSKLEQEAKQVYTAIQTVSLAPNDHSSLSKDGLIITDNSKFESALEETLGKTVTLLESGDKAPNEPTIYFVRKTTSPAINENVVYSSFEYHVAEINGKKAVTDVVTGEVKVDTSNVETGEGTPSTSVTGGTTDPITDAPVIPDAPLYEDGWHLVSTVSEIKDGDQIVIAAKDYDVAMSTLQKANNRGTAAITKNNDDTIELSNDVQPILVGIDNEKYTFNTSAGYLYAASSSENSLKSYSEVDDNGRWTISIVDNIVSIVASGTNTRKNLRFNKSSDPQLFSCYSSGQTDVVIYKNYGINIEENAPLVNEITLEDSNLNLSLTRLDSSVEYPPIIKQCSNGASIIASKDDFTWTSNSTLISFGEESIIPSGEYGNETVTVTATLKEDATKVLSFEIIVDIQNPTEVPEGNIKTMTLSFSNQYNISTSTSVSGTFTNEGVEFGYAYLRSYRADGYVMFEKNKDAMIYNNTAIPGKITKLEVTTSSGCSTSAVFKINLFNTAQTTPISSGTELKGQGKTAVLAATESDNYSFFNISSLASTGKNGQITTIVITYLA